MNNELHTNRYIVAFIDLLGASEAIRNNDSDTNLNTVNHLLSMAINICNKENRNSYGEYQIKAFSDNIVVAHALSNLSPIQEKSIVHELLYIVSTFQFYSFQVGILVRGGITIGDLFVDARFVWGKALLRAYQLESKIALYPRIVVDNDIYDLMKYNENGELCHCHIIKDSDNINYLDYCSFIDDKSLIEYIKACQKTIDQIKKLLQSDEKALQKLAWQENYLTRCLEQRKLVD